MKHIPRIYCPQELGRSVTLFEEQSRRLLSVMRIRRNGELILYNEKAGEWLYSVTSTSGGVVTAEKQQLLRKSSNVARTGLAFCPIKPHNVRIIIEKCTELGITDFYPITSKYTNAGLNLERVEQIAISASEQSERMDVPIIHQIATFEEFATNLPGDFTWLSAVERNEHLKSMKDVVIPSEGGFIVGPEGGWTSEEANFLVQNTIALRISDNILRAETAAIVCTACLCAGQLINESAG
ncbi:MAG: 16S rRNA (uracil(1498)-N(3))-methyltransferase [Holosporales bacterium]|nr:16S rRNA (uracil(1498)-N(3))-methyltransferase [Holosporales bacterium]